MRSQPPCVAWAEKLVLRREDLSPADRAALDAHVQTCPACEAAQDDYHFLDSRLRALPLPTLKPFPRLSLQSWEQEKEETAVTRMIKAEAATGDPRLSISDTRKTAHRRFAFSLRRALPVALVASLILAMLLVFGIQTASKMSSHAVGATLLSYTGHNDFVDAVAWSPNGQFIASGSWDGTVQVWDAHTGAIVTIYRGHSDAVDALAWSPDGQYIASGSWDGTARVWNPFTGALQVLYVGHSDAVSALAWSPDGQYIASGSWDHTVQVWYARTGETLRIYKGHSEFVDAVAWSPNGQYIASGDRNNTVNVWNPFTGDTLQTDDEFNYNLGIIEALAWSPDGRNIAAASRDKTVRIWQAFTGTGPVHLTYLDHPTGRLLFTYTGHTDEVSALTWSPNGKYIASGSYDKTVQIWNANTGVTLYTYRGHNNTVDALAWSPNGRYIASGSWDDTVQIWAALSTR